MKSKRLSIRLDPYLEGLMKKAKEAVGTKFDTRWHTWVVGWAAMAVFREIIRTGEFPVPLGVEFTRESEEEFNERCGHKIAAIGKIPRFKWKPEDSN